MIYRPKVYTASKLSHNQAWRDLADKYREIEFIARWLAHPPGGPDHDNAEAWSMMQKTVHWAYNIQDVQRCDFLLAYCGPEDDRLVSGTIAEIGAAIALGKIVLMVNFPMRHSIQYHPLVFAMSSRESACDFILGRV